MKYVNFIKISNNPLLSSLIVANGSYPSSSSYNAAFEFSKKAEFSSIIYNSASIDRLTFSYCSSDW